MYFVTRVLQIPLDLDLDRDVDVDVSVEVAVEKARKGACVRATSHIDFTADMAWHVAFVLHLRGAHILSMADEVDRVDPCVVRMDRCGTSFERFFGSRI